MELLKITREDSRAVWDEHFKTILLLLLETLGDKDVCCLMALYVTQTVCTLEVIIIQRNHMKCIDCYAW